MAPPVKTFQLLEINIISAQDLEPVSKKMKTYATAWMNPKRKLSSCVDAEGHTNPTWNDKFVFRVEEEFLRRDTSAVMIEIYAGHWFRDILIGTVRVLVGNLVPPPDIRSQHNGYIGMRFVALQVRRPSGRPQGILNLGVAVLDPSMRSMPLYTQPSMSAVGYRDIMDGPPSHLLQKNENTTNNNNNNNNNKDNHASTVKPILRRSRSERSELLGLENFSPNSSMIIIKSKPKAKESSILSITECMVPLDPIVKKAGKASSVISGAELREKPRQKGKKGKASSVVSDSIVSKESTAAFQRIVEKELKTPEKTLTLTPEKPGSDDINEKAVINEKQVVKSNAVINISPPPKEKLTIGKPVTKFNGYDYGGPRAQGKYVIGAPYKKGTSFLSDSEVGPSPSEVAAAVMAERRYPLEDNQSSVLDGWSMDESVEGLRSKLERWRMELPPLYDRGGYSTSSYKSSSYRTRKHAGNNDVGLFSCFGNIFGYECQCVCGKPPGRKGGGRYNSPSTTPGRSFI